MQVWPSRQQGREGHNSTACGKTSESAAGTLKGRGLSRAVHRFQGLTARLGSRGPSKLQRASFSAASSVVPEVVKEAWLQPLKLGSLDPAQPIHQRTKTSPYAIIHSRLESFRVRISGFQLVVVAGLCLSSALAQTPRKVSPKELPPTAFKLISVKTTGTQRYKSEEIVAASGLQIGQAVSEDDFKKAARLLNDTGAFSDVLYSFQYSSEGTKLELQLHDVEPFVPVRFDNLVWFSDQELLDQLHAAVPLFQGQLPVAGELADQVSNALQGLLIAHKVQGEANYLRAGPEDGPVEAFVFTVVGPQIHIRNIAFAGAGEAELPLLESAARKLQGADFSRSILRTQEDKNFLPIYLQRGYLKATFGDAQAKVVEGSPQETAVDVTFPVDPGRQYKLVEIEIGGYKSFSVETLRQLMHAEMNQPANRVQLDTDIEAMKKLYGTRGYMAVGIRPYMEMDDTNSTVNYALRIQEGDVYSMGDLDIRGLDSRMSARLEDDWRLRGGDPYDSSYPKQFLDREDKEISVMSDWDASVRESLNAKEHTVDVTLRFNQKPR
jgi:outer membrane protein assembly factor BamA